MKTRTQIILSTMNVIFWVIFIGLCIKTGAMIISFAISLFINAEGAKNLYLGLNLSDLYKSDIRYYVSIMSFIIFISGLKAYIAYLVVKIFLKFNFAHPFDTRVTMLISKISHVALGTGILALIASGYSDWLMKKGFNIPQDWGSSEFLFLAGIIFIIAEVFKKGVEVQAENELTV